MSQQPSIKEQIESLAKQYKAIREQKMVEFAKTTPTAAKKEFTANQLKARELVKKMLTTVEAIKAEAAKH